MRRPPRKGVTAEYYTQQMMTGAQNPEPTTDRPNPDKKPDKPLATRCFN